MTKTNVRIQHAFIEGQTALMPYFPIGYPTFDLSISIIERLCAKGADIVEIGVPFSDPLADGPTIQAATQISLRNGTTLSLCLTAVQRLRQRGVETPFVIMSYYNPILQYGVRDFIQECSKRRVDGVIIPDLPPEESDELINYSNEVGLAPIFLLTPNSTDERITQVSAIAQGFVYLVSIAGITGARNNLPPTLQEFTARVRMKTNLPLAVGFGISTPAQVSTISQIADGVIIGSALIDRVRQAMEFSQDPIDAVGQFLEELHSNVSQS